MEEMTENEEDREEIQPESETTPIEMLQLKKDAEEYKNKYLRLLADSENARKRLQKDREESIQYSIRSLLLDFLHPIDHLETALNFTDQASEEVKHWAAGFKMILNQFKEVLANNGVKAIQAKGQLFDPHLHEAVEMIPTADYSPGTVVEESSKGYTMGSKTLRPSRVKVAKTPLEQSGKAEENKKITDDEVTL